jgi:aromatic-L-amino-acid decarboxylase
MSGFREDAAATTDWIARYLDGVRELPVLAQVEPGQIRDALPAAPPARAEPFAAVLRDLDEVLLPGITHWNHPRFFGYFAISGTEPGILAEFITAALNVNGMIWRTSPAATELEELAVDWVRQLLGLPEGLHGHIEDTASTSTLAALAAARSLRPEGVVLCSEHAHSSMDKAARLLGVPLRKIAADAEYRMRPDALAAALGEDEAAAVVATVGTTSSAAVDPVDELAPLCADAGAWLHVDAAYAGSAMVCEENRWAFAGVELADSLVVNPHKWLLTPIDCSLLYTRCPDVLRDAFAVAPAYLRTSEEDVTNLTDYSPTLGRRFRALKLWAVIRCYGREGLQEVIREHQRLARLFASWVEDASGWEVVAQVPFSLVCFRREGPDEENAALLERVNATGEVYLSNTVLAGRYVLRLAVGNLRTTEDDVRRAWELLRELAVDPK